MKMEVNKSFTVNAPIDHAWDFISDPTKVVTCVPGARITEQIDELNYKGMIEVKIGPMLSQYEGDATLEEKDDANYNLSLVGKGIDTKGKGSASMNMKAILTEVSDNETEVESSMTIDISGKVATLGSRMIKAVNNQMFEQFKNNFTTKVETPPDEAAGSEETQEEEAAPINAIGLGLVIFWGFITSPFRKLYHWIKGTNKDKAEEETEKEGSATA